LPIFDKKAKRNLSTHPKFYFFDVGVFQSIRPRGPLDEALSGPALETLVVQHLRAWIDYSQKEGKIYFWRTKAGLEIDLILYGELGFYALEVKNSSTISLEDLRGLHEFKKHYPECTCILLYGGKVKIINRGILCFPVEDFLLALVPNQDIPL